jgi:IS30 family transposase
MTMIDQRPAEVADRDVCGHWEGDLILGEGNRSAMGTLVERSSRYVILLHLPGRHTAEAVRDAVVDAMAALPAHMRRSLTWDQGSEMALHSEIAQALDMPGRCTSVRRRALGMPLAAAQQREHQRAVAPVLSQGNQPARA